MIPSYGPWGQPQPAAQPQSASSYAPMQPYQSQPMQPPPVDPLVRVLPLIQQAGYLVTHLTANQLAILFVIAAVGKRTNNHPYFPSANEQSDTQVLRQLQLVDPHGDGYTLTAMGDAVIVAERLTRMMVLA